VTYNRRDWLTAVALTLVIAILAACAVTTGVPDWGDDFAGYMNEGMAIADGRFQESPGTVLFDSGTSPKGLCRQL